MGSLHNLAGIHSALPISTWAGQNLNTRGLGTLVTRDDTTWTARVTISTPLYRAMTVTVQEDQAEGLGLLYSGLYTID